MKSQDNIRDAIDNYNIKPKKSKGQNFLNNDEIIDKIVNECTGCKYILEIGPGTGVMTEKLSKKFKKLVAIELDDDLIPLLENKFSQIENVTIIHGDALKFNFDKLISEYFDDKVCICANIPYYISTPLLEKMFNESRYIERIVLMVQKEFADKICSKTGTRECVPLTYLTEYNSFSKKCFNISPSNFTPNPKVTSTVVKFEIKNNDERICCADPSFLYRLIKESFTQRRKKLVNSVDKLISKEMIEKCLLDLSIKQEIRGEEIDLNTFCKITNYVLNQ